MTEPIKRIYRSRGEAQIAGVCGGIAEYLNVDPVVVRLVAVVVTFFTGVVPGVLAYLAAWIIVPQEPSPSYVAQAPTQATDPEASAGAP